MSLQRKKIDFPVVYREFERDVRKLFQANGFDPVPGIHLYQLVYNMCNSLPHIYSGELYRNLLVFLDQQTDDIVRRVVEANDVLKTYALEWERFEVAAGYMNKVCQYLNTTIANEDKDQAPRSNDSDMDGTQLQNISETEPVPSRYRSLAIDMLAFALWKDKVLFTLKTRCGNRLILQVLDVIRRDRDREHPTHLPLIRTVVQSLVKVQPQTSTGLSLYRIEFEKPFLAETSQYYEQESLRLIGSCTISEYMKQAMARIKEEERRCRKFCDQSSFSKVAESCDNQMIALHQEKIKTEFKTMMENERLEDCSLAYQLLNRIRDGIKQILASYEIHLVSCAKAFLRTIATPTTRMPVDYVEGLLEMHARQLGYCIRYFHKDEDFLASLDRAARAILNITNPFGSGDGNSSAQMNGTPPPGGGFKSPEILARYCDIVLNKRSKVKEEGKLDRVIILFKYLEDKDLFLSFYCTFLANRLLNHSSTSLDQEYGLISQLREVCGVEYTSKLQRMFTDVTLSQDMDAAFADHLQARQSGQSSNLHVVILTSGSWPVHGKPVEMSIPPLLQESVTTFTSFYHSHYSGRKLSWLWQISKADVRAQFDRRYELSVTMHQACVLLVFNNNDVATKRFVEAVLQLSEADVDKALQTLVESKILRRADDNIVLNTNFTNKRTRIRVGHPEHQENDRDLETAKRQVDSDRRLFIQAAIVRIMKSRRKVSHTDLVSDVIQHSTTRFSPKIAQIKWCIEHLIEKQFIERSAQQSDVYLYTA